MIHRRGWRRPRFDLRGRVVRPVRANDVAIHRHRVPRAVSHFCFPRVPAAEAQLALVWDSSVLARADVSESETCQGCARPLRRIPRSMALRLDLDRLAYFPLVCPSFPVALYGNSISILSALRAR